MINYIWMGLMLIGLLWGAAAGNLDEVTRAIVTSAGSGVELCIELLGIMCLWSGIMNIAKKSGLIEWITKKTRGIFGSLFPDIPSGHPALGAIVLSFCANFFGLGNAATPLGIKAMEELQRLNPDKTSATDDMILFMVINASCIQFIPTTVIALRQTSGSANPAGIIPAVLFASACSTITGLLAVFIFRRIRGPVRLL